MLGLSGITLDYVTHCNISAGWTVAKEHNCLKYQAIQIGMAREANKMTVYTKIKACFLYGEVWLWIKAYNMQKDVIYMLRQLH